MMKTLVTGADGFIGSHLVDALAALIAIPYSYRSPEGYTDTNVKGTLNIVQAARDLGVERVIHTSRQTSEKKNYCKTK